MAFLKIISFLRLIRTFGSKVQETVLLISCISTLFYLTDLFIGLQNCKNLQEFLSQEAAVKFQLLVINLCCHYLDKNSLLTINKLRRYVIHYYIYTNPEAYLEPRQTSKMELFMKIVNGLKLLTIFSENFIPNV